MSWVICLVLSFFCKNPATVEVNPVKGDVSDSHLNAGGGRFDHPLEINEGAP